MSAPPDTGDATRGPLHAAAGVHATDEDGGPAARSVPVTVVIAAHDEALEMAACVHSVRWARQVLVVENDSTDATVEEARAAGAEVFSHPFRTIGAQRNAAISRAAERWILVLDADERGTPAFGREVARVVAASPSPAAGVVRAYRVRRRNFFFGREISHGGWERDRPVRLFDAGLRYDDRPVHEHVVVDGAVGTLVEPLLHVPYATLDEYFEKLTRYSRSWAEQHFARGRRARVRDLVLRPVGRVVSMLVLRGGWRDGVHGVVLAALAGMSVTAKYAQLWARQRGGPPPTSR
jgi:glycosyltransferase involved in cell wall biosynthesis